MLRLRHSSAEMGGNQVRRTSDGRGIYEVSRLKDTCQQHLMNRTLFSSALNMFCDAVTPAAFLTKGSQCIHQASSYCSIRNSRMFERGQADHCTVNRTLLLIMNY